MKLVIDTCVWVAALNEKDAKHKQAEAFVDRITKTNKHKIILPSSIITEFICALSRLDPKPASCPDKDTAMRWAEWMRNFHTITIEPISKEVAEKAGFLGAHFGLRGMDALLAYVAVEKGCDGIVSFDNDFKRVMAESRQVHPIRENGMEHGTAWEFEYEGKVIRCFLPEDIP